MNLFLRAKHWQIFLFTFGLPVVIYGFMIGSVVMNGLSSFQNGGQPDPANFLSFFKIFPALMVISMGTLFSWMWSIAIGLQKMLPPAINMKTTLFKVFLFFPLVYILFFCLFFFFALASFLNMKNGSAPSPLFFAGFAVIFPLHLFSMFCIFFCINFVAKTIKTVEVQRPVTFSDYIGEFFLVWFHFIGVWILQPRINKMLENYESGIPQGPLDHFS